MNAIKITNTERTRKRESKKEEWFPLTPPKYIDKKSTLNTVGRMSKKFGFDTENLNESAMVRQMRVNFENKAAKYVGGGTFTKKQTRFDKMRFKEETGFQPGKNPIVKQLGKVDRILKKFLLERGLFAISKAK